jgi:hypothetical protein
MDIESKEYFLKMIRHLREQEEIMLYGNLLTFTALEAAAVGTFLKSEYEKEASGYPPAYPAFNTEAALWAAQLVYVSAQLMLYRENKEKDLTLLLPSYVPAIDSSAMVSADLCLRFLPDMLIQLKLIDSEDALIELLEKILQEWHYSGVAYEQDVGLLDFTIITSDASFFQMYCDRIFENKKLTLAQHPVFRDTIVSQLGIYGAEFWNELKRTTSSNELPQLLNE